VMMMTSARTVVQRYCSTSSTVMIFHVLAVMTAGHTSEYVNSVLAKVAAGDSTGGLTVDDL